MPDTVDIASASPTGFAQVRQRRFGFALSSHRLLPRPAAVVSEEQILALVEASHGLSRRRRDRCHDVQTAADEL